MSIHHAEDPDGDDPAALPQGTRLFEYRVDEKLGQGRSSITYLAHDTQLNEKVVVEEYYPVDVVLRASDLSVYAKAMRDREGYGEGLRAFLTVARAAAVLRHPNVLSVRRVFEAHGTGYIVTEFVEGQSLDEILATAPLPEPVVLSIFAGVLDGLAAVHEQAVLHRGFKPGHVILRGSGVPVLVDFGQSRVPSVSDSITAADVAPATSASPEPSGIGGRTGLGPDIYALGAVLYRAVTGQVPRDVPRGLGGDPAVSASQAAVGQYDPLLLRMIDRMMMADETERPGTIAEIRKTLPALGTARPVPLTRGRPGADAGTASANVSSTPSSRRRVTVLVAAALASIIVLAAGASFWWIASSRLSNTSQTTEPRESAPLPAAGQTLTSADVQPPPPVAVPSSPPAPVPPPAVTVPSPPALVRPPEIAVPPSPPASLPPPAITPPPPPASVRPPAADAPPVAVPSSPPIPVPPLPPPAVTLPPPRASVRPPAADATPVAVPSLPPTPVPPPPAVVQPPPVSVSPPPATVRAVPAEARTLPSMPLPSLPPAPVLQPPPPIVQPAPARVPPVTSPPAAPETSPPRPAIPLGATATTQAPLQAGAARQNATPPMPATPLVAPASPTTRSGPGAAFQDCPTCPTMTVIPAGSFSMGSLNGSASERPVHPVTIAPFAMGQHLVTFTEWDACVVAGGCAYTPADRGWGRGDHPVINLSWSDVQTYVAWLSKTTGQHYRLPSEAEWEYADRGGTATAFWWGDAVETGHAACADCETPSPKATFPVRTFAPNGFGLYDTAGNAAEWVEDCWTPNYDGAPQDGRAIETGSCEQRVLRGGSFANDSRYLRSASRFKYDPNVRYYTNGFRVARDLR